jgi:hypothetical protein
MDGEAKDKGAEFANDDFGQTHGQLKSQYDAQVVKGVHNGSEQYFTKQTSLFMQYRF